VRVVIFLILSLLLSEHREAERSLALLDFFLSPRRQMISAAENGAIPDAAGTARCRCGLEEASMRA
jgi:hypothetical protein